MSQEHEQDVQYDPYYEPPKQKRGAGYTTKELWTRIFLAGGLMFGTGFGAGYVAGTNAENNKRLTIAEHDAFFANGFVVEKDRTKPNTYVIKDTRPIEANANNALAPDQEPFLSGIASVIQNTLGCDYVTTESTPGGYIIELNDVTCLQNFPQIASTPYR